jgi:hypothetical protein
MVKKYYDMPAKSYKLCIKLKSILETKDHFDGELANNEMLTAGELVRKHMNDRDHIVTEEELKKVVIGGENSTLTKDAANKKDEIEPSHDDNLSNPYKILGG